MVKLPHPIISPARTRRQRGRGIGRSSITSTPATMAKRVAANSNGGASQVLMASLATMLFSAQIRHTNTIRAKSRRDMAPLRP